MTSDSAGSVDRQAIVDEVSALRASLIKSELKELGIDCSDLFEKNELVERLVLSRMERASAKEKGERKAGAVEALRKFGGGVNVPLKRLRAREGTLGSHVRVDEKDYYAIELSFPNFEGVRADFVVDSAASNSILAPAFSARVKAPPTGVTATASAGTASGGGLKQVSLGRVQLGGQGDMECGTLEPIVMELPVQEDVGGLVGLDFLRRFHLFLDFQECSAVFLPPASITSSNEGARILGEDLGLVPVPLFYLPPPAGLYFCKVRLSTGSAESATLTAVVDLGSTFTIVNTQAIQSMGISEGDPRLRMTDQVISGAAVPGQAYTPIRVSETTATVKIGGMAGKGVVNMGEHRICVADLPAFAMLGIGGPAMIVGLDVLAEGVQSRQLSLDVAQNTLWLPSR